MKLSISYKNNKLFIMVMHIRGLVSATHTRSSRHHTSSGFMCWYGGNNWDLFGLSLLQQPIQDGNDPDPYVKIYLLPDPQKTTKRKTKVARKTCNPTYNEMVWLTAWSPQSGHMGTMGTGHSPGTL